MPEKGLFDVPVVWSLVRSQVPDGRLVICGKFESPYHLSRFKELLARLDIQSSVEVRGFVSEAELVEILRSSKALIYPSIHDSFSLCILEALSQQTPVVCYDIPAVREVYRGIPEVVRVPLRNVARMAQEVSRLLVGTPTVGAGISSEPATQFIKRHHSWDAIAEAEFDALRTISDDG